VTDSDDQNEEQGNGAVPEGEPTGEAPVQEAEPQDPLAESQAELGRVRDMLLRTAADFDNYRKRSRREMVEAEQRAREDLLRELLPVFDNLERAMQHADSATDVQGVVDGIRIVMRQFTETLGKLGVTRVESVGNPFDPAVHEAIQHLESSEHAPGTVMAEAQPGYRAGDRLIRPALVVVSKGSPAEPSS
jgi:molecular chaperone GrpE